MTRERDDTRRRRAPEGQPVPLTASDRRRMMTYQELIIKLIEIQKHMMPDLEKFEREGRLPHDLKVAKAEIIEWEHTVDGDGGLEEAPEIWPVEKFARALREHYDDFNDFMRRNIAEYEALAAQLPEAYAHPLGQ